MSPIEQILDLARWAPSGDNTQPWRFEIVSDDHMVVHGFDTRDHCVYDLDGHPSQLSIGALLETIRIAASGHALGVSVERRRQAPETRPVFDVRFIPDVSIAPSELVAAIPVRCVQRRAMDTRSMNIEQKAALAASLPPGYELAWLEGRRRWEVARLLFSSAEIRLTTREAFEVHRRVIQWDAKFSEDRIPDRAIGLDPVMTRIMAWAMQDWRRVWFLNTFLAGTVMPRLQLDLLPALRCGGHVLIVAPKAPRDIDDYVTAGAAVQRFWLKATVLKLQHQPEMTPLIFGRYVRGNVAFTQNERSMCRARQVHQRLEKTLGRDVLRRAVWMGRVGYGRLPASRSVRLPLERLLVS